MVSGYACILSGLRLITEILAQTLNGDKITLPVGDSEGEEV
jgi:hypothetical protein